MKVLILSDANSIHTLRWAQSLKNKKLELVIFTLISPKKESSEKYNKLGINVKSASLETKITNFREPNLSKINYIRSLKLLNKTIKKFNPDLIHAHYASSYGVLACLSRFKPMILSVWGTDIYHFPYKNIFNKCLIKLVINKSNAICSTSEDMKKIIEKDFYRNDVNIVPFGINPSDFYVQKNKNNEFYVGTIKSIENHNGIDCLLEAAAIVIHKYQKNIKFLIVGDGSLKLEMQQRSVDLKINEYVEFKGFVSHENVLHYFNQLSIFVAVSTRESFGVSVLEAAACQVPSITSNIGGLKEVNINNKTGIVIDPNNPHELAVSIIALYEDNNFRKTLGKNARNFVKEKFNWKDNVNQMVDIYKKNI